VAIAARRRLSGHPPGCRVFPGPITLRPAENSVQSIALARLLAQLGGYRAPVKVRSDSAEAVDSFLLLGGGSVAERGLSES
jgi:hypothetical protein